jgi:hypothetical protein
LLTTFYHYLSLVTSSGGLMVNAIKKFLSWKGMTNKHW